MRNLSLSKTLAWLVWAALSCQWGELHAVERFKVDPTPASAVSPAVVSPAIAAPATLPTVDPPVVMPVPEAPLAVEPDNAIRLVPVDLSEEAAHLPKPDIQLTPTEAVLQEVNEASGTQAIEPISTDDLRRTALDTINGTTVQETLIVDNQVRQSWVDLPCSYRADKAIKRPLIIVLHGSRLSGRLAKRVTGFDKHLCQADFIVAYPDALNKQWNDGRGYGYTPSYGLNDVKFILQLAQYLEGKYGADANRVYLVGYSSGGMLAQKIAIEAADKIAGIGVIAASLPKPQYLNPQRPKKAMPVVIINGTKDKAFPWGGGDTTIVGVKVGPVVSIPTMVDYWLEANGGVDRTTPAGRVSVTGSSVVEVYNYLTNKDVEVTLFKIEGGGHTWPGSEIPFSYIPLLGKQVNDLKASEIIWKFLSPYHR